MSAAQSGDAVKKLLDSFDEENGNPIILEKPLIVPMEPGALDKLKGLSGQK